MNEGLPPLKSLHSESSLIPSKIVAFENMSNEELTASLQPGQPNGLKARPDGTILEGNHRVHVLRKRGVNVDKLPREIVARAEL